MSRISAADRAIRQRLRSCVRKLIVEGRKTDRLLNVVKGQNIWGGLKYDAHHGWKTGVTTEGPDGIPWPVYVTTNGRIVVYETVWECLDSVRLLDSWQWLYFDAVDLANKHLDLDKILHNLEQPARQGIPRFA